MQFAVSVSTAGGMHFCGGGSNNDEDVTITQAEAEHIGFDLLGSRRGVIRFFLESCRLFF